MLQWCSAKQFLKIWHQEKQRWNLLKDNYPVLKKLYCELAKLLCCLFLYWPIRPKQGSGRLTTHQQTAYRLDFQGFNFNRKQIWWFVSKHCSENIGDLLFLFCFFHLSFQPWPLCCAISSENSFYQLLRISLPLWTQFFHFSLPQPSWTCSSQMGEQEDETWSCVWGSSNTVWFPWKRPEKYGAKGAYKCLTSMSVVQVKSKPASISLQAPPWNSLLRLFSCVATRSVHRTKGITLKTVKHTKSPLSSPHHQLNAFVRVSAG